MSTKYYDIEQDQVITIEQLRKEYEKFGQEYESFSDYLKCSMTSENGTLIPYNG